jgi:hypothetical protein
MRLARAVSLAPSSVDLFAVSIAPVLCRCAMALPAVRADAAEHPFVPWEGRKGQPFRAFGAALGSWRIRNHSREILSPGLLGVGLALFSAQAFTPSSRKTSYLWKRVDRSNPRALLPRQSSHPSGDSPPGFLCRVMDLDAGRGNSYCRDLTGPGALLELPVGHLGDRLATLGAALGFTSCRTGSR